MSEVKLVLTDIDGTLVRHGQYDPTQAVAQAITDVQDAGVELTAATGRPYEMMEPLFDHLGFRDLAIFDAGASIRKVGSGELVWSNWIDPDRTRQVAEVLLPHCVIIDFYPGLKQVSPEEAKDDLKDIVAAPYVFAFAPEDTRQPVTEALQEIPNLTFHIGVGSEAFPDMYDIQITDKGSDKYHAVNALRKLVHSEKSQTLAIGDSTNDLPLFQNAGTKVAMGNAMESLKVEADHIVGDVSEDGFVEAMQRFVLRQ